MLRALLTAAALLALAAPSANAAILQVDTGADVAVATPADCTDGDIATACSIRDALAAAGATAEDDRVLVPAGDYVLNGTSLPVTGPGNVTLVGEGAATTAIDGNDASTVLDVFVSATIQAVAIRDGKAPLQGGGIFAHDGTLTVRDSVIESNEAGTAAGPQAGEGGGIALDGSAGRVERSVLRDNKAGYRGGGIWTAPNSDPLTVVDSTVTANRAGPATAGSAAGGGIWASHELNLVRVALTGNEAVAISSSDETASAGGAIALDELTVTDSTITGNHARGTGTTGAEARGGGLYLAGSEPVRITGTTLAANTAEATAGGAEGGAIRQFSGPLTITNSTISGNSVSATGGATLARGGGAVIDTPSTLINVTIAGNGATGGTMPRGGNLVAPDAALRNTLVAGGTPANCEFTVASAVGSLETGSTCGLGAGNRSGVASPRLGPLAANGGPTLTHALLAGSPAIDTGTKTGAPATDQRGVKRAQRDGIDTGAYELAGPATSRPGAAPDRTAPVLAGLDLTRDAFRARRGTTVLYSLTEAATVTFRIERRTTGRRVDGRCVKRTRSNPTRPRCIRYLRTGPARTRQATAGTNRLRLRTRRLKPGRYRLAAVAVDLAGNRSARSRVPFRILTTSPPPGCTRRSCSERLYGAATSRVERPTMDKDPLDVDLALERLGKALPLQLRSAAAYTIAAGSITGFQYLGLSDLLWRFAEADLADARRLIEKIVTLGGEPVDEITGFGLPKDGDAIVKRLIELEREAIEALQDTIPATGHTGDSEALEHRLEHIIMRKQEQVDTLLRAARS
jgi:bacterioferritin (cytochrome b1)